MAQSKLIKVETLEHSASHLLHRAGQIASEIFSQEAGGNGLTPRQFAVLLTVHANEGLSQTDLVGMTGIDRSTLADVVRRLLRKGLLKRRRTKEDQRAYSVRLSSAGHDSLAEYEPRAISADDRILQAIPNELRAPFLRAMQYIVGDNSQDQSTSGQSSN